MTKSYSSLLSWFGLTLAASLMLYHTSDRVTALERQLRDTNMQIEGEQQSLHVLKAEWVYLANPARIEAEAKRYLAMQPAAPSHVVGLSEQTIAALAPLRNDAASSTQTQIAEATIQDAPAPSAPVAKAQPETAHSVRQHVFASINSTHINDHVLLQHGTVAQASTDTIGGLINSLSLRP